MAYDDGMATRIEDALSSESGLVTKKMFGGLAFLLDGHLCCGVVGTDLMLRIGPDAYDAALAEDHTRAMDFTGKPMRGLIYVEAEGIAEEPELRRWISRGVEFVRRLPPK